jgi:hypothetical protein
VASERNPRWSDIEPEEEALMIRLGIRPGGQRPCPPPELLQTFHLEGLQGELEVRVKAHVEICRFCQGLLRDLATIHAPLTAEENARIHARVFPTGSRREPSRKWRFFWPIIPALAAAAVVLIAVWIHNARVQRPREIASSVAPAPAASLPVFALEKPSVALPLPILMRGASGRREAYLSALARALKPYQRDDYRTAETQLQALAAKYPKSSRVLFYGGVSALLAGGNDAAVKELTRAGALAHGSFVNECRWYLALAEVRSGHLAQAAATLHSLCSAPGEYHSRACTGVAELSARSKANQPR